MINVHGVPMFLRLSSEATSSKEGSVFSSMWGCNTLLQFDRKGDDDSGSGDGDDCSSYPCHCAAHGSHELLAACTRLPLRTKRPGHVYDDDHSALPDIAGSQIMVACSYGGLEICSSQLGDIPEKGICRSQGMGGVLCVKWQTWCHHRQEGVGRGGLRLHCGNRPRTQRP